MFNSFKSDREGEERNNGQSLCVVITQSYFDFKAWSNGHRMGTKWIIFSAMI